MKIIELIESKQLDKGKPTVFVDMDGVLADLFGYAGDLHDVEHYNEMTPDQWETFFRDSDAYHLFKSIGVFPASNELLEIVKKFAGDYDILSSPLNFDRDGSIKGKREWLNKNITVKPKHVIFDHDKAKYAVQKDGTPNILIDDYGVNIRKWIAAGGIGIKYQADEDRLDKVVSGLRSAFKETSK
jgi:5'(3')-deoxyribonucleotidase